MPPFFKCLTLQLFLKSHLVNNQTGSIDDVIQPESLNTGITTFDFKWISFEIPAWNHDPAESAILYYNAKTKNNAQVKSEYRNSKRIRIPNDNIINTNLLIFYCFCLWNIFILVIVLDFEIRVSYFW